MSSTKSELGVLIFHRMNLQCLYLGAMTARYLEITIILRQNLIPSIYQEAFQSSHLPKYEQSQELFFSLLIN